MDEREFWRNERIAFLALTTLRGVGFWTLHKLCQSGVSFKEALRAPSTAGLGKYFLEEGGEELAESLWQQGLELARHLERSGVTLRFQQEALFPIKLKNIPDAPFWIFIQGNAQNLAQPAVTIVGARKATDDGIFLTKWAVAALAGSRYVTVSGLATGIDQAAHNESIRFGLPTVAVLGTGILQDYPKGSDQIRARILEAGGTIISEYLPNQSYSAESFVRRNRLQAALGETLVPTEWKIKSGTAHTVRFANKYGKRIALVRLPSNDTVQPEVDFAISEYGASVFIAPIDAVPFLKFAMQETEDEHIESAHMFADANMRNDLPANTDKNVENRQVDSDKAEQQSSPNQLDLI